MLLVLSAQYDTPANTVLRGGHASTALDALTSDDLAAHDLILFDIDLADVTAVGQVRAARGRLKAPPLSVFAVDRGRNHHLNVTQANALGARAVVTRPYGQAELDAALAALDVTPVFVPPRPATAARPPSPSVEAARRILGASFAALSTGAPLDCDQAAAASRELFLGIGQEGLHGWLDTVRVHHSGTFQHCLLVTGAAVAFAREAGLSEEDRTTLTMAALLHDIGKAQIPNSLLDKPGKLTADEFAVIRRHSRIGAEYLIHQHGLSPAIIDAVLHHHEYLDGSGYPDGLKANRISRMARILTVCDVYGALVEQRSYKEAKSPADALYVLIGMAQQGKVDYGILRTLAAALGSKLPVTMAPGAAA
ncbi:MAG: HD domain-containing protein [Hyphomicrobiales bacterium]|nr:MAG: HD domain-containing protein [Hyphomicrobiales bacterium]